MVLTSTFGEVGSGVAFYFQRGIGGAKSPKKKKDLQIISVSP